MDGRVDLIAFLGDVEKSLLASLVDRAPGEEARGDTLMGAARHLCIGSGGKRARPMMVRLFADACGAPLAHLVDLGVCAELIHSASLLHDDVVDAGMFRRGRPTVNARWGNIVAVMSGDLLLTVALGKLARIDTAVTQEAVNTVSEMTRAAIAEVEVRGEVNLPLDRLRYIAEGKTGALFAWCGAAAALLANDSEAKARFSAFGRRLGVAFQIADDIRDITGLDRGKPQYADLQSRTPSLPILLAARRDEALSRRLKESWAFAAMTPDRVSELGTAVLCSGAIEGSLERMNAEIAGAVDVLGAYASTQGGAELVGWAHRLESGIKGRSAA